MSPYFLKTQHLTSFPVLEVCLADKLKDNSVNGGQQYVWYTEFKGLGLECMSLKQKARAGISRPLKFSSFHFKDGSIAETK